MKLKQQVCSLELAKRLKELGVKQEGFFVWSGHTATLLRNDAWAERDVYPSKEGLYYAAFTVAELGEMLPHSLTLGSGTYFLTCEKNPDLWWLQYPGTKKVERQKAPGEADARALMLIHLLENNLITL
jgi:hypothetical protein